MKAFKIFVALLVMAVFVTAGSAFAGKKNPLHEDRYENFLYESEKSMTGSPEQAVGAGPFFQDRYENFLYVSEKGVVARSSETAERFLGIQPSWDGLE